MDIESSSTMSDAIRTAHHYHDWVFETFSYYLQPGVALEIGSGHGQFSKRIANKVQQLIVSDIDPKAIDAIKKELANLKDISYLVMNGIDKKQLTKKMDNIILVNVLEHIENDKDFLKNCKDFLNVTGHLIIYVPAFQSLYSRMDKDAGHYRRYKRSQLIHLLENIDFKIVKARYVNAMGFFGWLFNKWVGGKINSTSTNTQISIYNKLIPIFKKLDRFMPFMGQSLLIIATPSKNN